MRKRLSPLPTLIILLSAAGARLALANAAGDLPGSGDACGTQQWGYCNPVSRMIRSIPQAGDVIVRFVLGLLGTIALFSLVYAGVTYITATGDEAKITKAKGIIKGTVIGLAIALLTYSLLQTVMNVLHIR